MHNPVDAAALSLATSILFWTIIFGSIWLDRIDRERDRG